MPVEPHNFPTLRGTKNPNRPSVLLLGAGMSYGLVPSPSALLKEKRGSAEAKLGFAAALPWASDPAPNDLYVWADEIIQLMARTDPNPKLTLAHSLDIPYEDYWMAYVSSERSSARHRIIARFARERLWDQIWSLNWDCIQENAFENVGIKRDGTEMGMPWPTVFRCFITAAECAHMGESQSVKIIKPHGCVMALLDAEESENRGDHTRALQLSERFLVTATELASLAPTRTPPGDPTQEFIFENLCVKLCELPFVVGGWRAAEGYLLDYIDETVRPKLDARDLSDDELSVIDIEFNAEGHTRLATSYRKDKGSAHIQVEPVGFDVDQLFLWLQALYAVGSLSTWAVTDDQATLSEVAVSVDQPPDHRVFVTEWADNFLPVWVRLCWRCGLVSCFRGGQPITSDDINLESRDEHIPWVIPYIERPDLTAASRLLAALHRSGNAEAWDFEMFPGGLHKGSLLLIPVPAWDNPLSNDLRGLKPLVEALKRPGTGFIDQIKVLFLSSNPAEVIPDDRKRVLKELLARDLAMLRFAKGSDIIEIRLEDI